MPLVSPKPPSSSNDVIADGHLATEQEMYDILGEIAHDMKKDIIKSKIQHDVIHAKLIKMELQNQKPNDHQMMSLAMLQAQMTALPELLQTIQEERFKVFESLKKKK